MGFHRFPGRLLVICPHFDDACFSVGGFLLKKPSESVTILTVFSKSQHAPQYEFFYPLLRINEHLHLTTLKRTLAESISAVRKKEDSKFCRRIGAVQSFFPFEDSSLRGCIKNKPIPKRTEMDRNNISRSVFENIEKWVFSGAFDTILSPLGIGNQVDHLIVLSSIIKILKREPPPSINFFFYEDLPYAGWYELDLINEWAFERIFSNKAIYINITNEMQLKQELMDIYYSQHQKKKAILKHGKRLFDSGGNKGNKNGYCERIWKFEHSQFMKRNETLATIDLQ